LDNFWLKAGGSVVNAALRQGGDHIACAKGKLIKP